MNPRTARLALFAATLLFVGCQTSRYEAKVEPSSFGFSSQRLSDRRFAVMFEGATDTGLPQVKDFALLRAAELTREAGATHFKVIADRSRVKKRVEVVNRPSAAERAMTTTPDLSPPIITRHYPVAWFEIEIYPDAKAAGPDQTGVFNAAETQATVSKKYRLGLKDTAEPRTSALDS